METGRNCLLNAFYAVVGNIDIFDQVFDALKLDGIDITKLDVFEIVIETMQGELSIFAVNKGVVDGVVFDKKIKDGLVGDKLNLYFDGLNVDYRIRLLCNSSSQELDDRQNQFYKFVNLTRKTDISINALKHNLNIARLYADNKIAVKVYG